MAIRDIKEERRYRAYIKELESANFIENKTIKNKNKDNVEMETTHPIQSILESHLGNKINILI
jgi:hypothetical protein